MAISIWPGFDATLLFPFTDRVSSDCYTHIPVPPRMAIPPAESPGNPLWPCESEYGVPLLRLDMQATQPELPFVRWGREARRKRMAGTWHFYTEDYRFEHLWSKPGTVVASGCTAIVEPNYSCHEQTPRARVLYLTYRKRWLARYWQEMGIRILADLNVAPRHAQDGLLGVPAGWSAYATRGSVRELDALDDQLQTARERAGLVADARLGCAGLTFVVYGGGRRVGDWCELRGAAWVREEADLVAERRLALSVAGGSVSNCVVTDGP